MPGRVIALITTAVLLAGAVECGAVDPVVSDDAKTQGHRNIQLDINYSYEYEKADEDLGGTVTRTQEVHNVLTYGLSRQFDVILGIPFEYKAHSADGKYSGIDDIILEVKWKFHELNGFHVAVMPLLTLPTGDYKTGDGNGRATYGGTVFLTQDFEPFSFSVAGTYIRNENRKKDRLNIWKIYFSPVFNATDRFSVLGSVGIERDTDHTNKKYPVYVTGGVSYALTEFLSVSPAFKAGLNKRETDLTFIIGTSLKY